MSFLRKAFPIALVVLLCAIMIPPDPDSYWQQFPLGSGPQGGVVRDLVSDGASGVYVAGGFTSAGGVANTSRVALFNGTVWSALDQGCDGEAFAIARDGTTIYLGGAFSSCSGVTNTNQIAMFSGGTWSPLGTGMNDQVRALLVDGTDLYAGGRFTTAGAANPVDRIAMWSGGAWSRLGTTGPGENDVYALAKDVAGDLIVGGSFNTITGVTGVAKIAKWTGTEWQQMDGGMSGGNVFALAMNAGVVYAGGSFTSAGGDAGVSYIARWTGSDWVSVGSGVDGTVYALEFDDHGNLYATGAFGAAGGSPAARIAAWNGSAWKTLGSGLGTTGRALENGSMWVGGEFTVAGGAQSYYFANWTRGSLAVELVAFDARREGSDILLTWTTESEADNAGFAVEHLGPEIEATWTDLTFIEGRGSTDAPADYAFRITDLEPGLHQFRLRQIDLDGTETHSSILEVELPVDRLFKFEVPYPNPFRISASVRFAVSSDQHLRAELIDIMGRQVRVVFDGEVPANRMMEVKLDAGGLAGGTYLLRLNGKTFSTSERVVVVK